MIGGIDLGGTKIEARAFDGNMTEVNRRRIPTDTSSYQGLLNSINDQITWLNNQGNLSAIGLGTPGLINPRTGCLQAANLPVSGKPLAADIANLSGQTVPIIKDCRAFALAEATLGAGKDGRNVMGLIIGTGVAGGHVIDGRIPPDLNDQHGEFGHLPLPASIVEDLDLPLLPCGCGSIGCFETYLSGPGLSRLALHLTGVAVPAEEVFDACVNVKSAWIRIMTALLTVIIRTADPDVIVLGGGVGMTPDLPRQLDVALRPQLLSGTNAPRITQAKFGDASGAVGAAIFAHQMLAEG